MSYFIAYRATNILQNFYKGEGEGSRGGHVIGHTKSGNPKYGSPADKKQTSKPLPENKHGIKMTNMDEAFKELDTHFKGDSQAEQVIKFLKPLVKANKNIRLDTEMEFLPKQLGLSYSDGRLGINVNSPYAKGKDQLYRTLLHEMVHAVTKNEIEHNETLKNDFRDILMQVREKLGIKDDDMMIPLLVSRGVIPEDKYGVTNEHEMIAEVFTNKKFRDYLRGIKYEGDNLLKRIFISIASAFSKGARKVKQAKHDIKVNNVADYLVNLTERVIGDKQVSKKKDKKLDTVEKAFIAILMK